MGSALLSGVFKTHLFKASQVLGYDISKNARQHSQRSYGIALSSSAEAVLANSSRVLIAIKPQDTPTLFERCHGIPGNGKLIISICAGISIQTLQKAFGPQAQICRAMPNTPAVLGLGASAMAFSKNVTATQKKWCFRFFKGAGIVSEVPEKNLNAITGLSGSGPAYGYYLTEALALAGIKAGLQADTALRFSAQTLIGAATMVLQSGKSVPQLIADVSSKGGTTVAGMHVLTHSPVRAILEKTVKAASARAKELSRVS